MNNPFYPGEMARVSARGAFDGKEEERDACSIIPVRTCNMRERQVCVSSCRCIRSIKIGIKGSGRNRWRGKSRGNSSLRGVKFISCFGFLPDVHSNWISPRRRDARAACICKRSFSLSGAFKAVRAAASFTRYLHYSRASRPAKRTRNSYREKWRRDAGPRDHVAARSFVRIRIERGQS